MQTPRAVSPPGGDAQHFSAAAAGQWDLDLAGSTLRCSPLASQIFGQAPDVSAVALDAVLARFLDEDRDHVAKSFVRARTTGLVEFEKRVRRLDDAIRWVHVKGHALTNGDGAGLIGGLVADVTDWHLQEETRHQAEKMQAMERLCGRIAHDYNNLLMVIGANLELLGEQMPTTERAERFFAAAHHGVARGSALNRQLLGFSARHDMHLEVVDAHQCVLDCEESIRDCVGKDVAVNVIGQPGTAVCRTDPAQLRAGLLNLASNALDAMPGGGALTLGVGRRTLGEDAVGSEPGDYAVVSVTDTGAGMTAEAVSKGFEPFYTTKAAGLAKGLGLSQVYGLARQCGGFVTIESEPSRGTTVRIHFPCVSQPT
ncbi:MAG TPA: ATP-binding protein [Candidimonas sp.]|nr:ATP-binding protein [Candidimonas sp.]